MSISALSLWMLPRLVARELISPEECSLLKLLALRGEQSLLAPFELYVHECKDMAALPLPAVSGSALEGAPPLVEEHTLALVDSLKTLYADFRLRLSDTAEVVPSHPPVAQGSSRRVVRRQ